MIPQFWLVPASFCETNDSEKEKRLSFEPLFQWETFFHTCMNPRPRQQVTFHIDSHWAQLTKHWPVGHVLPLSTFPRPPDDISFDHHIRFTLQVAEKMNMNFPEALGTLSRLYFTPWGQIYGLYKAEASILMSANGIVWRSLSQLCCGAHQSGTRFNSITKSKRLLHHHLPWSRYGQPSSTWENSWMSLWH